MLAVAISTASTNFQYTKNGNGISYSVSLSFLQICFQEIPIWFSLKSHRIGSMVLVWRDFLSAIRKKEEKKLEGQWQIPQICIDVVCICVCVVEHFLSQQEKTTKYTKKMFL